MIPALFLLVPTKQAQMAAESPAAPSTQPLALAPGAPQQVVMTVTEWSFTPSTLQLAVGQPVTLVLDNKGQLDHDLSVPALGVTLTARAGKSAS
ncbi:MAG: cupredoxin domain-containing protein, partial [Gemmatimonadales bacterium]